MSDAAVETTISDLATPIAQQAGLDLLEVRLLGSGSRTRVRVVVDRKGGVDVGTCQQLSRSLEAVLDDVDRLSSYTLEVTSPGTDRPLRDQRDFDRIEGRTVRVTLRGPGEDDGQTAREVTGVVTRAEPVAVTVRAADGSVHQLPYSDIDRARQVLPW